MGLPIFYGACNFPPLVIYFFKLILCVRAMSFSASRLIKLEIKINL